LVAGCCRAYPRNNLCPVAPSLCETFSELRCGPCKFRGEVCGVVRAPLSVARENLRGSLAFRIGDLPEKGLKSIFSQTSSESPWLSRRCKTLSNDTFLPNRREASASLGRRRLHNLNQASGLRVRCRSWP
jgi:hypothetical protein